MKALKPLAIWLLIGSMVASSHSVLAQQPQTMGPSVGFYNVPAPQPFMTLHDHTGTEPRNPTFTGSGHNDYKHLNSDIPASKPSQAPTPTKPAAPQTPEPISKVQR